MGGLGGFVLPVMFGALVDLTGISSSVFMLLWGITLVSLVWMYWTEIVPRRGHADENGGGVTGRVAHYG
jgi:NNP family nitrate/nitrite transporter-like MFS transporter